MRTAAEERTAMLAYLDNAIAQGEHPLCQWMSTPSLIAAVQKALRQVREDVQNGFHEQFGPLPPVKVHVEVTVLELGEKKRHG